jgi:hypothetical protein
MKLPITFEQFRKNPIAAVTFLMFVVVSYLYVDQRSTTQEIITELRTERTVQAEKIDRLTIQLRKTDSALAVAVTELRVLSQLKRI